MFIHIHSNMYYDKDKITTIQTPGQKREKWEIHSSHWFTVTVNSTIKCTIQRNMEFNSWLGS